MKSIIEREATFKKKIRHGGMEVKVTQKQDMLNSQIHDKEKTEDILKRFDTNDMRLRSTHKLWTVKIKTDKICWNCGETDKFNI